MYSLHAFGSMIRDEVRMSAYTEALRRSVKPGSVVIDIGAGTGIFSFIACQFGARHVYAIEPNPLVDIGKSISATLNLNDRITFIQDMSTNVTLPELADVIVGDIRGQVPMMKGIFDTYADAKTRLLKPDGVLIPQRDTLYAALVSDEETYQNEVLAPWKVNPYGLDMSSPLSYVLNKPINRTYMPAPEQVLCPPQIWTVFQWGDQIDPHVSNVLRWTVEHPGTAHFLHLWFNGKLVDGVEIINAPGAKRAKVYGSITFPLSEPLALEPGNVITLDLRADPTGSGFIYRWTTQLYATPEDEAQQRKSKQFVQSTFFGQPISNAIKRTVTYKPRLSVDGYIDVFILQSMAEGTATLEEIAHSIMERFPKKVPNFDDALARVAVMSQNYSE